MTLRFDFFYENADVKYFLALLQKLANACEVDLRAESSAEILSVFASAESSEILSKFASFLQVEVPHSLYFKLKNAELCKEMRGEKITLDLKNIFTVSEINAIKNPKNPHFCEMSADSANLLAMTENNGFAESSADSALLKSALQNICTSLQNGQSVALSTSKGKILLSTKSDDFDFILANDIATLNLYSRATQDEISALASFEKPLIELAIKEVFVREVGAKCAKFILPFDIALCCLSSMLLAQNIAFVRGKFAESSAESSAFFEIVVGQNGYFLHKNYVDSANFREFLALNFGAQSSAKIAESNSDSAKNIIIYLSLQNSSIFACSGEKIINIAFDKNPKNILQKITTLENGEKLIANFGKEFRARYEAILALDSAPQMSENLLDIFECAAMILGFERDKSAILNLANDYLRDIGPKIDFKNYKGGNSVLGMQFRTCGNFRTSTDSSLVESPKISTNTKATPQFAEFASEAKQPSLPLRFCESQNLGENHAKIAESRLNSAELQNLKNDCAKHPKTRPLRGAKNREQGCRSATADFLLEAEKRGSPPKSEKAAAFWRVGGAGRGVQPFLREELSNNENTESVRDLQNRLPHAINCARNDDSFLDSSPAAQNDNFKKNAESSVDSAPSTQEANYTIADEFLGLCKASDKDKTKVYRGSEPKHSLKSRCESKFAFYDELRTVRSVISFTLAGTEPEVIAFGIIESLVDYLILIFRDAQNQFGTKNIAIAGDMFANKVFFDKITKKIPADFKLIFPKYLDF